jgi:hypothetical protein
MKDSDKRSSSSPCLTKVSTPSPGPPKGISPLQYSAQLHLVVSLIMHGTKLHTHHVPSWCGAWLSSGTTLPVPGEQSALTRSLLRCSCKSLAGTDVVDDEQLVRVSLNYLSTVLSWVRSSYGIVVCLTESEAILSGWCLTKFETCCFLQRVETIWPDYGGSASTIMHGVNTGRQLLLFIYLWCA